MKKITYKTAISFVAILFLVLWGVWYSCYYYTLYWQEGFSFFNTLPDFTKLQVRLPEDIFIYSGAYLLQFFRVPLLGAAIQAGVATFVVSCLSLCIIMIMKDVRLIWLAFIPVPAFVAGQYADITLERSMLWCAVVFLITVIAGILYAMKLKWVIPGWLHSPILTLGIPVVMGGASVYLLMDVENDYQEKMCRIDYHANHQEWQEILRHVSPQETRTDEIKLRYVLLALNETGQLADYIFRYGIKDDSQFLFYGSEDPFDRNFNALFYRALDMPNEIVHQCYQQALTSPFGFNFKSLRMLVDAYLETGNYALAYKYMEILRHTSFHQKWIESRIPKLNEIKDGKNTEIKNNFSFVGNFLDTITSLVNQDPTNQKYMDLCLCAILTTRNAEYFRQAFQFAGDVLYKDGRKIPRHYEEALLLLALRDRDILNQYNISKESRDRFSDFINLYSSGRINAAKAKYPDSYWSFVF